MGVGGGGVDAGGLVAFEPVDEAADEGGGEAGAVALGGGDELLEAARQGDEHVRTLSQRGRLLALARIATGAWRRSNATFTWS